MNCCDAYGNCTQGPDCAARQASTPEWVDYRLMVEAEWRERFEAVKSEANYWHQRHEALINALMKNAFLHAHPPVTLMAEPESFNAGFNSGKAAAERQMMQLFTDPENQPTQHGTVTVEYMQREIAAEREACAELIPPQYFELRDRIRTRGQA